MLRNFSLLLELLLQMRSTFFCTKPLWRGLPFEVKQPRYNTETESAMEEARAIMAGQISVKRYPHARALFNELDSQEDDE